MLSFGHYYQICKDPAALALLVLNKSAYCDHFWFKFGYCYQFTQKIDWFQSKNSKIGQIVINFLFDLLENSCFGLKKNSFIKLPNIAADLKIFFFRNTIFLANWSLVNVIIRLILSLLLRPKVITLSGVYCINYLSNHHLGNKF